MECKEPRLAMTSWKKNNEVQGLTLPNFRAAWCQEWCQE